MTNPLTCVKASLVFWLIVGETLGTQLMSNTTNNWEKEPDCPVSMHTVTAVYAWKGPFQTYLISIRRTLKVWVSGEAGNRAGCTSLPTKKLTKLLFCTPEGRKFCPPIELCSKTLLNFHTILSFDIIKACM